MFMGRDYLYRGEVYGTDPGAKGFGRSVIEGSAR
jgi:hypothetical protein